MPCRRTGKHTRKTGAAQVFKGLPQGNTVRVQMEAQHGVIWCVGTQPHCKWQQYICLQAATLGGGSCTCEA